MLLAARQPEPALMRARAWLAAQPEPARWVAVLAGALGGGGRPDLAVALLQPFARPGADPDVLTVLAQALHDVGNAAAGLELLERLDSDFRPAALMRLRLALDATEVERAVAAAYGRHQRGAARPARAPRRQGALGRAHRRAQAAAGDGGGSDPQGCHPVLAARIFLALEDRATARRWADAGARAEGSPARLVQLAAVEARLGRGERVHERWAAPPATRPSRRPSSGRSPASTRARASRSAASPSWRLSGASGPRRRPTWPGPSRPAPPDDRKRSRTGWRRTARATCPRTSCRTSGLPRGRRPGLRPRHRGGRAAPRAARRAG